MRNRHAIYLRYLTSLIIQACIIGLYACFCYRGTGQPSGWQWASAWSPTSPGPAWRQSTSGSMTSRPAGDLGTGGPTSSPGHLPAATVPSASLVVSVHTPWFELIPSRGHAPGHSPLAFGSDLRAWHSEPMKTFFTNFTRGMLPLLLVVAIGFKLDGLAVELFCLFLIFLVWDLKQHMTSLVAPRINLELIGGEPLMPVVTAETLRRGFSERELDACAGTGEIGRAHV